MNTKQLIYTIILLFTALSLFSQTPGQKKQAEEMQKNAEKMMKDMQKMQEQAQRQYDSIQNTPEMKKAAAKNKKFAEQLAKERKAKASQKQASSTPKASVKEYYISKGSGTKFENWDFGPAEVVLVGMARYNSSPGYQHTIGTVEGNGNFNFELPEDLSTFMTVSDSRWVNCTTTSSSKKRWSNPGAGIIDPTMRIMKNGEEIGTVFWASSTEVLDGQTTTSAYHGTPGHLMDLVYVRTPSKTTQVCTQEYRYGEGKDYDLHKKINVEFKKGWNMIKTTFEGERIFVDWGEGAHNKHNYYKYEKVSAAQDLYPDTKWIFIPK